MSIIVIQMEANTCTYLTPPPRSNGRPIDKVGGPHGIRAIAAGSDCRVARGEGGRHGS